MKIEDLKTLIGDEVKTAVKEIVAVTAKEKVEEKVEAETEEKAEEVKAEVKAEKTEVKAQQISLKPEDEIRDEAQKEADKHEWKSFAHFAAAIWDYRLGGHRNIDNRLIFIDKKGRPSKPDVWEKKEAQPLIKTQTEGTDSAGGFLVNMA